MNLAMGIFLCLLDPDLNMKALERRILKKAQVRERADDDQGKSPMLLGIREVTTW